MSKVSFNPLTIMKGLQELSQTQKSGTIGEAIEYVLKKEDSLVDTIVANKDEFAKPETRTKTKEGIELFKKDMKKEFGTLTDKDVPKTISQFNEMAVNGITTGMLLGNINIALALIPEAKATTETPASVKATSLETGEAKNNKTEDMIEEAFLFSDMFADLAAEQREELTKPSYRQETIDELNSMKEQIKTDLSSVTEKTLPKTINEALGVFMEMFSFGIITGVVKTALGLIPVESIAPKPGTGLPGDGGGPAICPKPPLPEPVICPLL